MKKKRIFSTLIKNYILFTTIVVFIVLITITVVGFSLSLIMVDESFPMITADSLARADYENMDLEHLKIADGWVEVLNENGDVIYIKGDKKTDHMNYDIRSLSSLLGFQEPQKYFYQSTPFLSQKGESLILLVVIPHGVLDYQLNLSFGLYEVSRKIITVLLIGACAFLILFMINIFFYSKWTARKIQKPLDQITEVIQEMGEGNSYARMSFKAEYEFSQIRDAFNQMADRLQKSEDEKRKLEESRKRMFVDISHDLKTPITTINGFSKALSEGMIKDEEKARKYLNTIYNKSNRMAKLIDDIFELSKLDSPEQKTDLKVGDLVELIRSVVAEHYEQVEYKNMKILFESDAETLFMKFNPKEISRVISNLICNAILYNEERTNIYIGISNSGNIVTIDVGDNGKGIPEHMRDMIFSPFIRGDHARNSEGGSGLGLAIAMKIIENHGGTIELVKSNETYKTLFRITLIK